MTYHHGDLKRALLAAGVEMLQQGKTISLRALAQDVGVTPSAVYRHFANKNQLLAALAEEGFCQLAQMFDALDEQNPQKRLLDLGETYVNFALAYPVHYNIMFGDQTWKGLDQEPSPELQSSCHSTFEALEQVCTQLTEKRPELKSVLIAATWSQVHGFALLAIRGQVELLEQPVTIRDVLDLCWRNMAPSLA